MTTPQASSADTPTPDASSQVSARPVRAMHRPGVIVLFLVVVAGLFAADIVIKYWAFDSVADSPVVIDTSQMLDPQYNPIPHHQPKTFVPQILSFWLTVNRGAVFGMGQGARPVFILVSIVATAVIMTLFLRSHAKSWVFHLGLAMVLGGALGNLYDRVVYYGVRDMFYLFPGWNLPFGLSWPGGNTGLYPWIFNFADVALVAGVILLGILSWRYDMQKQTASRAQG